MIFIAILVLLVVIPIAGLLVYFNLPNFRKIVPIYTFALSWILMDVLRSGMNFSWRNELIEQLSPMITFAAIIFTLSALGYLAKGFFQTICNIGLIGITSVTVLFSIVGCLGIALAFSRTSTKISIQLNNQEQVKCRLSGNALDAFAITSLTKIRKIPYTPFEKDVWNIHFKNYEIFYGKKGFKKQMYNGKNREIFWANAGTRYNDPNCKYEVFRKKNKGCKEISQIQYIVPVD